MYYRMDGHKSGRTIFATVFKVIFEGENRNKWTFNLYDDESDNRYESQISFNAPYFKTKYEALHYLDSFSRKSGKTILNITILNNF